MKKYIVLLESTKTGFSGYIEEITVASTGKTLTELKINMIEALNLRFEERKRPIKSEQIIFQIEWKDFLVKYGKILNMSFVAHRSKIHTTLLSQYVNGKKYPSKKQIAKIQKAIHEIANELLMISF